MRHRIQQPTKSHGNSLFFLGVGVGALAMFLGDPQTGRRRRALIRDQYVHTARKVEEGAGVVLRDTGNRATGVVACARGWIREHIRGTPDDAVLVERVRAALGRATSHPHAVQVEASDGRLTLKGVALSAESDEIVSCAKKVPGVKSVANQLDLHDSPDNIPSLQGGVPREGDRIELLQDNWSPAWRSLAGALGAGLTMTGWIRGGVRGCALGAIGGGLLARAATNRDLKSLVGAGTAPGGVVVHKSIHVDAPVEDVYRHWTVENFPQWMSHVREVKPLGDNRHHWVVDGPANVPVEWDAVITEAIENQEMSWASTPGSTIDNAGRVRFAPEGIGTRVDVALCYIPPGGMIGHAVAKALGSDPKSLMDDDLMRFKALIETGTPAHDAAARRLGTMSSSSRH